MIIIKRYWNQSGDNYYNLEIQVKKLPLTAGQFSTIKDSMNAIIQVIDPFIKKEIRTKKRKERKGVK